MASISRIGIAAIYHSNDLLTAATAPVAGDPTKGLTPAELKAFLADENTKTVPNVHQDTWNYDEAEDTINFYTDQLTGEVYRGGTTAKGAKVITFTVGKFDFTNIADFKGGTAGADKYGAPSTKQNIYKSVVALTEDGVYIVFPKAFIQARDSTVDNAIGMLVTATAMVPDTAIEGFVQIRKSAVDAAVIG